MLRAVEIRETVASDSVFLFLLGGVVLEWPPSNDGVGDTLEVDRPVWLGTRNARMTALVPYLWQRQLLDALEPLQALKFSQGV